MKLSLSAKNILIAIFSLIGIIALSVCITLVVSNSSQDKSLANTAASETADEAIQDWSGNQQVYTGEKNIDSISIPGLDLINLKADSKAQTVNLYNPPANNCYFKISIILNNTILWQSPLLAPGKSIYSIEMNTTLKSGEYKATLKYECFSDFDAQKELNGSEIGVVLKVFN